MLQMKRKIFIALSAFAAIACHAETATQSLQRQDSFVTVVGSKKITAPDGQSIDVTNTIGMVTVANASAAASLNPEAALRSVGPSCSDRKSGSIAETATARAVICVNGRWQDAASLPLTRIRFDEFDQTSGKLLRSIVQPGSQTAYQSTDDRGTFTLLTKVDANNYDNTANIQLDVNDAGSQRLRIETKVKLGAPTVIATGPNGHQYRVQVIRAD
jgi:hypothetical protein